MLIAKCFFLCIAVSFVEEWKKAEEEEEKHI